MHLQAQILKEIKQIENDDFALTKLLEYIRNLVKSRQQHSAVDDSVINGLMQIKKAQKGELKLNTLDNLIHELVNSDTSGL